MRKFAALFILTLTAMWSPAARALIVFGYNATVNDRFCGGYATAPVNNASGSFVGSGFDWSGVGWSTSSPSQSVALITPQNFVAASHFEPAIGTTLTFFGSDNVLHAYTVAGYSSISFNGGIDDLAIGTLTAAISASDQVAFYPVLALPQLSDYVNRSLLVYGHHPAGPVIGTNTLDAFGSISLNGGTANDFVYQTTYSSVTGSTQGEGGDSGGPTFTVFNGALTVLGVHSAVGTDGSGTQYTFDSFIPSFIPQINTILSSHGGYSVTAIPEPATAATMLGVIALGAVWGVRRRRGGA